MDGVWAREGGGQPREEVIGWMELAGARAGVVGLIEEPQRQQQRGLRAAVQPEVKDVGTYGGGL